MPLFVLILFILTGFLLVLIAGIRPVVTYAGTSATDKRHFVLPTG